MLRYVKFLFNIVEILWKMHIFALGLEPNQHRVLGTFTTGEIQTEEHSSSRERSARRQEFSLRALSF